MDAPNALGEFLKARRNQVDPKRLDGMSQGTRRVTGLRSEELEQIAGISVDYYRRIEQGRMPRPSPKVLAASRNCRFPSTCIRARCLTT